jgi:signal transduction histidine kinase
MRSLRGRILGLTIGVTIAVLALTLGSVYLTIRTALLNAFDDALLAHAMLATHLIEQEHGRPYLTPAELNELTMNTEEAQIQQLGVKLAGSEQAGNFFIVVDDGAGNESMRSANARDLAWPVAPEKIPLGQFTFASFSNGARVRQVRMRFMPHVDEDDEVREPPSDHCYLTIAEDATALTHSLDMLERLLGGAAIAGVVITLLVAAPTIRRGMRPLDSLAAAIGRAGPNDLRPLPFGASPSELLPVIGRLNTLLEQVAQALERERGFSADVAHELRTPLAGLVTALEVASDARRSPTERAALLEQCRTVAIDLAGLVENLLLLARYDAGLNAPRLATVDLTALVESVSRPLREAMHAKQIEVAWNVPAISVVTDTAACRVLVRNLLENAVNYCDVGGRLVVEGTAQDAAVVLRIANTGCAVVPAQAERVFDRFWRGDAARSGNGAHSGLGLALVKQIAAALGHELTVTISGDGWFVVTVRWALAPRPLESDFPRSTVTA